MIISHTKNMVTVLSKLFVDCQINKVYGDTPKNHPKNLQLQAISLTFEYPLTKTKVEINLKNTLKLSDNMLLF